MKRITADSSPLSKQAPLTVNQYLEEAIRHIDRKFGKGYARANPALVGAFIQAAAADRRTSVVDHNLRGLKNHLASVADALHVRPAISTSYGPPGDVPMEWERQETLDGVRGD